MQNATIRQSAGKLVLGGTPTSDRVRFVIFASEDDPQAKLVVEFDRNWTRTFSSNSRLLLLAGRLDLSVAAAVSCRLQLEAMDDGVRVNSLEIGGKRLLVAPTMLSAFTEWDDAQSVSTTGGQLDGSREFAELRVDGQPNGTVRPCVAVDNRLHVMLRHLPATAPEELDAKRRYPLGLVCQRLARWNLSTGAGVNTRRRYVLKGSGAGGRLALYDFAWRGTDQPPFAFSLAQFLAQAPNGDFVRQIGLFGIAGLGVRDYWNSVIAKLAYDKMSQRFTTVPIFELGETKPVKESTPASVFGHWALLFTRPADATRWQPRSLQALSAVPIALKLAHFRLHDGDGLTLWTRMRPPSGRAPFPSAEDAQRPIPDDRAPDVTAIAGWLPSMTAVRHQFLLEAGGIGVVPAAQTRRDRRLRVGALDFSLEPADGANDAFPQVRLLASAAENSFLAPELTSFDHDVQVGVLAIEPGGQDDIPLFSLNPGQVPDEIDGRFVAKPPMVVPLRRAGSTEGLSLQLSETPPSVDDAWSLSINVKATKAATMAGKAPKYCAVDGPRKDQVVVLDTAPTFVALVEYPFFLQPLPDASDAIVAKWNRATRTWNYTAVASNDACLVLPPQATGEEMEKEGTLTADATNPIGYRLGRPARLVLTLNNGAVNFVEPPWNIRRLFSDLRTPLQSEPLVKSLQFELLYGLPCRTDPASSTMLRLADIGRRLGDIPRNRRQVLVWEDHLSEHDKAYHDARAAWAATFERYQSRLLILEPFPDQARYSLDPVLLQNPLLSCAIDDPPSVDAVSPVDAGPAGQRLRGGALWGLESPNLYRALIDPAKPENRQSSSALLAGGGFTALGGYGHLESSFLKDTSKLIARVEMGRVSEYTVERKGRIGVFWNKCKHVIVYRRTVLPSEQFEPFQPRLAGRAIIRKYAEYIEIEEDARRFLQEPDATGTQAGFVTGCIFPKGTRINVRSAWGSDVGALGYRIPLWNPAAAAAQPRVYPKPTMGLSVVRAGRHHPTGDGQADSSEVESSEVVCTLEEPQNLCFFSYTADAEGDSDKWPAVEGVDYVDLPAPAPDPFPRDVTSPAQVTAAALPDTMVPPGFERVTFRVQPSDTGANLIAGREPVADPGASMAARIQTVTMMRGPIAVADPGSGTADGAARSALAQVSAQVAAAHLAVAQIVEQLADQAGAGARVLAYLDGSATPATDAAGLAIAAARDRYASAIQSVNSAAAAVLNRRQARLDEVTDAKLDALHQSLFAEASAARKAFRQTIGQFESEVGDVRRRVTELVAGGREPVRKFVDATIAEHLDRLRHMRAIAEPVLQEAGRLVEVATAFRRRWEAERASVLALLTDAPNRAAVEQWVVSWESRLADAARQLAGARPDWLVAAPAALADLLAPYRKAFAIVREKLPAWDVPAMRSALSALADEATARVNALTASVCGSSDPTAPGPTDPSSDDPILTDPVLRVLACGAVGRQLLASRASLRAVVAQQPLVQLAQAVENALAAELRRLADSGLTTIANDIPSRARDLHGALRNQAARAEQQLVEDLIGQQTRIEGELRRLAQGTADQVRSAVTDLRDRAGRAAEAAAQSVARDLKPLGAALGDVGEAKDAADKLLKLARAFGDPPELSQLGFSREKLGYFYPHVVDQLDRVGITPVVARVMQVGNALKAAGLDLPVDALRDQLLPPNLLKNFKLNEIFSDFAGLKLKALFNAIPFPEGAEKLVKVRHGIDQGPSGDLRQRRAWLEARVEGVKVVGSASVFSIGPLELLLDGAVFNSVTRIASTLAGPERPELQGSLVGKWQLRVGGTTMLSFVNTELRFDAPGKLKFKVDPKNIQLADTLKFVTDLMNGLSGGDLGGLNVSLTPTGVESLFDLALAPIQIGTTAISNLRLGARFALTFAPSFAIEAGGFLGKRDAPFALTIFVLGGGGFLDVRSRYEVSSGRMSCAVALGISAAASVGIALGPIRGGVFVSLGFTVDFASGGENRGLQIGIVFVIRGEVSVLGIIDVCLTLYLELRYGGGVLQGTGIVSLKIKICWCFTLKVRAQVTYTLGCDPVAPGHHALEAPRITQEDIDRLAGDYVAMLI